MPVSVRRTIYFKQWIDDKVQAYCDRHIIPISSMVNEAVLEWLDAHEKPQTELMPPPMPEGRTEIDDFTKSVLEASEPRSSLDLLKLANKDPKP